MISHGKFYLCLILIFGNISQPSNCIRRELLAFSNPTSEVRYVMLSHDQGKIISICQIECFDDNNSNVTINKTVESSPYDPNLSNTNSDRITDGNPGRCTDNQSFYYSLVTNPTTNYVKIDLGSDKTIVIK